MTSCEYPLIVRQIIRNVTIEPNVYEHFYIRGDELLDDNFNTICDDFVGIKIIDESFKRKEWYLDYDGNFVIENQNKNGLEPLEVEFICREN